MKRIAIQGIEGSFHDIAAHRFFEGEEVELVCCNTFEEMFAQLKADADLLGLMAIENTIAGSLLHNYELLRDSGMTIVGEHKLRISHKLTKHHLLLAVPRVQATSQPIKLLVPHRFRIQHKTLLEDISPQNEPTLTFRIKNLPKRYRQKHAPLSIRLG